MSRAVNVLLIEDDLAYARAVARLLDRSKNIRFELTTTAWLREGLTALANRSYDVVLLDLALPDSSGIDTVATVRREAPNTPIIVLSATEDMSMAIAALKVGVQQYLVKRLVSSEELLEREILYAIERVGSDLLSKSVMRTSISRLMVHDPKGNSDDGMQLTMQAMLGENIRRVDQAVSSVIGYLQKNFPDQTAVVAGLLRQGGYDSAMHEIRSMLKLQEDDARGRSISEVAFAAVTSGYSEGSVDEAERTLLDVINGSKAIRLDDTGEFRIDER